ncbi:hypothetical protein [Anoxynatronum buryatiense]|uniref:Uncharacterized protein n=1 Tax=Anoxynatronum buryatiense TaxID=489973 RepID=A0AA45WZ93_9CLOT|nr:hypothetical protein [Anoxynatronum buryatiense]SMP72986.1 hypothetical protein SAMN06296020_1371 [Anoxynatronum buryatiense]
MKNKIDGQKDKKKMKKFYLPEIILIILSFTLSYFVEDKNNLIIIDNNNLIQLFFIIIGLSITLATFLYALTDRFKKMNDNKISNILKDLERSIILEIKRMTYSLILVVVITFTYSIDLPYIKAFSFVSKSYVYDSIKIFLFSYVLLAFIDIVFTVLNLFEIDDNDLS